MPYWCQNKITMEGIGRKDSPYNTLRDGNKEKTFDFNTIIPIPESLNVEGGPNNLPAVYYYLTKRLTKEVDKDLFADISLKENMFNGENIDWVIERCSKFNFKDKDKDFYELGKKLYKNYKQYDSLDWYNWRCKNWGTKWNACHPDYYGEPFSDDVIEFDTVWTPPLPIIQRLSELNPDKEIELMFILEEEMNKIYYMWFLNGKVVGEKTEDNPDY